MAQIVKRETEMDQVRIQYKDVEQHYGLDLFSKHLVQPFLSRAFAKNGYIVTYR
jgi:hypothetical protein